MAHEYRPAPMSLAQRAALRQQLPRTLRQPARRRVYPIIILLVVLAVLAAALGGFEYLYRDRIYPNVHVRAAAVDVGGLTQSAAATQLYSYSVYRRWRTVELLAPGNAPIFVPAHKLGYSLDRGLTAWRAYHVGRESSRLRNVLTQVTTVFGGATVPVAQRVNQSILHTYLVRLAPVVDRAARPGRAGRRLNVAVAQRNITRWLLGQQAAVAMHLPFTVLPALSTPHHITHHRPTPAPKKHHTVTH